VQEAQPLAEEAVVAPPGPVLLKLKEDMSFLVFFEPQDGQGTDAVLPATISSKSLPHRAQ